MKQIGKRIYFDTATGNVIQDTGERSGSVVATIIEQDIATFTALSERNRETFDVIELPFGANAQDFAECNGYRVNPDTKVLEFSYPDPNQPEQPQVFQKPLTAEIDGLKKQNEGLNLQIIDLWENLINGGVL